MKFANQVSSFREHLELAEVSRNNATNIMSELVSRFGQAENIEYLENAVKVMIKVKGPSLSLADINVLARELGVSTTDIHIQHEFNKGARTPGGTTFVIIINLNDEDDLGLN